MTPEDEKDAEFVVATLWDLKFMIEITNELNLFDEKSGVENLHIRNKTLRACLKFIQKQNHAVVRL